jgi:small conductance mechanosensitive channel
VLFLVILLVFNVLAAILGRVTRATVASSKLKISSLLRDFFVTVVTKTVFLVGVLIAISTIGIDIGPLLAGVGVLGFIIGFALQGTLSNFAAGIMILLYRPYDVGDVVNAAGVLGKVDSMSLVSTTILTPDNQKVIVPNNSIWGGVITNITAMPNRRVDLTIGVGYGDDLDRTQEILMEVVKAHSLVLQDPEPVVKVTNLGESSVDFVVRPWSKTSDYWTVYWDLTKSIKQRLDQEGISIPFPQRDVHVIGDQGGEAA